jgi:hypothetical protein
MLGSPAMLPLEGTLLEKLRKIVRAPKTFQHRTLWPEFLALSEELHTHLAELTDRVVREAIDEDVTEAAEGPPKALPESNGT